MRASLLCLVLLGSGVAHAAGVLGELIVPLNTPQNQPVPVSFVLRNASAVPFHGGTRPCSVNYVVSDARTGALLWTFKTPNQGCKTVLGPKIDLRAGAAGELYRSTLYVQLAGRHGKVGLRPGQYRISGTVEIKGNQEPARTVTTPPVLLTVQ